MNSKSFKLNIAILFTLLFVFDVSIFLMPWMGRFEGCSLNVLYYVISMCSHLYNFIDYYVITALKSTNEIKMHPLFTDSYISNKFG